MGRENVQEQTAVAANRELMLGARFAGMGRRQRPVKFDHAVMCRKHRAKETQYDEPASTSTVCLLAAVVPDRVTFGG
jgi:hypothetical protein